MPNIIPDMKVYVENEEKQEHQKHKYKRCDVQNVKER